MLIYNITFNVDDRMRRQWLDYVREEWIPAVLATGLLHSPRLMQLMKAEPQGTSYALQWSADDMRQLKKFLNEHWPAYERDFRERFGEALVYFPTTLKEIE
ncbi:MAG: DUF4286 family protein [Chlorobi bacterium]|nr:DUF4286 family protein [Chlorobiota bacterium]